MIQYRIRLVSTVPADFLNAFGFFLKGVIES